MRVGILDYANRGLRSGVGYYTVGLIRCLARQVEPADLIVYTNDPNSVSQIHPSIVVRKIPGRRFRAGRLWWQHFRLPRQAEADGLDVLHCPAYVAPLGRCRVPCVITVHDIHALNQPQWCSPANRLHYMLTLPRSICQAAAVIAVSYNTREAILQHLGAVRNDIRVIPPGIDDIFIDTADLAAEEECRRRHSLPDRYVLHVGNIEPRKNIPAGIEAVRLQRRRGMDHVLVLVGQIRRSPPSLVRMLSDARREGVVQMLGYVPRVDLPALYRMAAVVLCVSHHEGFGFPALEAFGCGAPVVSSMAGAMRETLGDAAAAVDPNNAQSIADAVSAVISDSALRDRLRREGLKRAAGFRWENFAGELRQVYMIACQKHQHPGQAAADH